MNYFNKFKFLKELRKPKTWLYITIGYYIFDTARFHFSEKYRIKNCMKELKDRFEFSAKFEQGKQGKRKLCTIYPTTTFDIEKLLEIANSYGVAISNDINNNPLKHNHIKIDFSRYNKILNFDEEEKTVSVEPGIKITDLINFLKQYNCTIPKLENYKYTNLTIREVLFNNYYNFIDGKFIDYLVNQITVIIPKGNRFLRLKQNDDINFSDLNLKSLFLRSNSTLGIMTEVKLNVKERNNFKYIAIEGVQNNLLEVFDTLSDLKEIKRDIGLKDLIFIKYGDASLKILLKLKEKYFQNCEALLANTGLLYSQVSEESFYFNLQDIYFNENILRMLKIKINKLKTYDFLKRIESLTEANKLPFIFKSNTLRNDVELIVQVKDNTIESIDNSYKFIENIHNWTRKKNLNIFGKKNFNPS
jgi:hypothetical protein